MTWQADEAGNFQHGLTPGGVNFEKPMSQLQTLLGDGVQQPCGGAVCVRTVLWVPGACAVLAGRLRTDHTLFDTATLRRHRANANT